MPREEYEELLDSTKNLGDINEMGEDDTENKTRGFSEEDEGLEPIPGITAGEDLVMDFQETLDEWLENMKDHGEDKLKELFENPDFTKIVIEEVTKMMQGLNKTKKFRALDDEFPVESKETNEEEIGNDDGFDPDNSPTTRIDGLIDVNDHKLFRESIQNIVDDLIAEGLEESIIEEYLTDEIANIVGAVDVNKPPRERD